MRLTAQRLDPTDDLPGRVFARLDARLMPRAEAPLAVALSGGGDSLALLDLTMAWAARQGRRVIALTVDHQLNPESAAWTEAAGRSARAMGADWRPLTWGGDKPATGLPAAARRARHVLIADAAREAGAQVVLFGHTADDRAEEAWMRGQGSTLGHVAEWGPSPAWPQGRGLMLFRPLLSERREALRGHLRGRGLIWLEDPANADPKFARSRARAALNPLPEGEGLRLAERQRCARRKGEGRDANRLAATPHPFARLRSPSALGRSSPLPLGEGGLKLPRSVALRTLAIALTCASGLSTLPRGHRVAALHRRLAEGEWFTATLGGARLFVGDSLLIVREAGRAGLPAMNLQPGASTVWDGRFEITVDEAGWTVAPALGRLAALSDGDRAALKDVPPAARGTVPVLIRDDDPRPVLAWRAAEVRCLVPDRFRLAMGVVSHEGELDALPDGERPSFDLCLPSRAADPTAALEFQV